MTLVFVMIHALARRIATFRRSRQVAGVMLVSGMTLIGTVVPSTALASTLRTPLTAQGAAVTITAATSPTVRAATSVTVTGTAPSAESVFVFADSDDGACADDAYDEQTLTGPGSELSGTSGDAVGSGSFSRTYSFTPAATGTYALCAYLATSSTATPDATGSGAFTASSPQGSLSVATTARPIEASPDPITVSGTFSASDVLYAFVEPGTAPCGATPYDMTVGSDATALPTETVGPGSFSDALSYTPQKGAGGPYVVCSYLDTSASATPDVTGSGTFDAWSGTVLTAITPTVNTVFTKPPITVTFSVQGFIQSDGVFIGTNPNSASAGDPTVKEPPTGDGQYTVTVPITKPGTYYWGVGAVDVDSLSYSTPTQRFTVRPAVPTSLTVHASTTAPKWTREGTVTISTSTQPWENITVAVHSHGHTLATHRARSATDGRSTWRTGIRCSAAGTLVADVTAANGVVSTRSRSRSIPLKVRGCGPKPKVKYVTVPPVVTGPCQTDGFTLTYSDPPLSCGQAVVAFQATIDQLAQTGSSYPWSCAYTTVAAGGSCSEEDGSYGYVSFSWSRS